MNFREISERKAKRKIFAVFAIGLFLSSCKGDETPPEEKVLRIATNETILRKSAPFLKEFAKNNEEIKIEVSVYDSSSLKYKSSHQKIDADIFLFDDLTAVDSISDSLLDLTQSEEINNYSSYIKNFIKNSDGNIYCLPSPGSVYCYCINLDLVEKYNMTIPDTIDDLIDFSNSIKGYVIPFVSSFSNNEYYLDAFMQACVPSFFATVNGQTTFDEFVNGKTQLASSSHLESFSKSLGGLYNLTVSSFFNKNIDFSDGIEDFFNSKTAIMSISPDFPFETYYQEYDCSFNYAFLPLFGRKATNGWACSYSDSYVSALKNSYKGVTRSLIDKFLAFYSSPEGQTYLLTDLDGNTKTNCFSYTDKNLLSFANDYNKNIVDSISQGRVFLIDRLYSTFLSSVSSFEEYALDKISVSNVIDDLDYNNETKLDYNTHYFTLPSLSEISGETKEDINKTLRVVSSGIKANKNLDILILNRNFLTQPIYNSMIYEYELETIFDESVFCTNVSIKGSELKNILDFLESLDKNEIIDERDADLQSFFKKSNNVTLDIKENELLSSSQFFLNGASILKDAANKKYILSNNNEIDDDRVYYLALPSSFIKGGEFSFLSIGSSFSCLNSFRTYLEEERR